MNCNCVKEIEKLLLDGNSEYSEISLPTGLAKIGNELKTVLILEPRMKKILKKSGKEQNTKGSIICSYCPFCGISCKDIPKSEVQE